MSMILFRDFCKVLKLCSILFTVFFPSACEPSHSVCIILVYLAINLIQPFKEALDWRCSVREVLFEWTTVHFVKSKSKYTVMLTAVNGAVSQIECGTASCAIVV